MTWLLTLPALNTASAAQLPSTPSGQASGSAAHAWWLFAGVPAGCSGRVLELELCMYRISGLAAEPQVRGVSCENASQAQSRVHALMSGSVQVSLTSSGRRPPNMSGARVIDHSVITVLCSSRVRNVGDAGP